MHLIIVVSSDPDQGHLIGSYFIKYGYSDKVKVIPSIKELELVVGSNDDDVLIFNDVSALVGNSSIRFDQILYSHFKDGKRSLIYITPHKHEDYLDEMTAYDWVGLEDGYIQLEAYDHENEYTDVMRMLVVKVPDMCMIENALKPDKPVSKILGSYGAKIMSSYHPVMDGKDCRLSHVIPLMGKVSLPAIHPDSPLPETPDQSDDDSGDSSFVEEDIKEEGEVSESDDDEE